MSEADTGYLWRLTVPPDGSPPRFDTSTFLEENLNAPELIQYFGQSLIEIGTNLLVSLANSQFEITGKNSSDDQELDDSDGLSFE